MLGQEVLLGAEGVFYLTETAQEGIEQSSLMKLKTLHKTLTAAHGNNESICCICI